MQEVGEGKEGAGQTQVVAVDAHAGDGATSVGMMEMERGGTFFPLRVPLGIRIHYFCSCFHWLALNHRASFSSKGA